MNGEVEYILAFESILYGLIVTRILIEWNKMIQERGHYDFYWAHFLLTIITFLMIVYVYISNYTEAHYKGMKSPIFFLLNIILPPTLFSISSYQMFPKKIAGTDFKEYLHSNIAIILFPLIIFGFIFTTYMSRYAFDQTSYLAYSLLALGSIIVWIRKKTMIEIVIVLALAFLIYVYIIPVS